MKKIDMKKTILQAFVAACVIFSGYKIYKFYREHIPFAYPGQCVYMEIPDGGKVKVFIIQNNSAAGVSEAVVEFEVLPGFTLNAPAIIPYKDMRDLNGKRINCDEEVFGSNTNI